MKSVDLAPGNAPAPYRLRSGTAARLAGLPVTTLRVWERRYGVVLADKTHSGQRRYSAHDVSRLRLLRQLTQAGHAIGTIATLELEALQALAAGLPGLAVAAPGGGLAAVVVGRAAAHALEDVPGCSLAAVHDDLDQAETALSPAAGADLLVVRVASLHPVAVERVLSLAATLRVRATLVIYAFATEASARSLADAGVTVWRDPVAGRELTEWVRDAGHRPPGADIGGQVAPRQFSDEDLGRLAAMPSPVSCECLRHMAELVSQLAAFERYSRDCDSTGPADAALHRNLSRTAGVARTLFERALQRVVADERMELEDEIVV